MVPFLTCVREHVVLIIVQDGSWDSIDSGPKRLGDTSMKEVVVVMYKMEHAFDIEGEATGYDLVRWAKCASRALYGPT